MSQERTPCEFLAWVSHGPRLPQVTGVQCATPSPSATWMAPAWHLCLSPSPWGCTTHRLHPFSHTAAKASERSKPGLATARLETTGRRPPPPDLGLQPACWSDKDWLSFAWGTGRGNLSRGWTPGGPTVQHQRAPQPTINAQHTCEHMCISMHTHHTEHECEHTCAHTLHLHTPANTQHVRAHSLCSGSWSLLPPAYGCPVTVPSGSREWTRAGWAPTSSESQSQQSSQACTLGPSTKRKLASHPRQALEQAGPLPTLTAGTGPCPAWGAQ